MAASEIITQTAHVPQLQYTGPWSYKQLAKDCPDIFSTFSNSPHQFQQSEPCFRQKAGDSLRCSGPGELRHKIGEGSMSEDFSRPSPPASIPSDYHGQRSSSFPARTLPSIHNAIQAPSSQDGFQRTSTAPSPVTRPLTASTPPDQRSTRPIGVQNLLNPAGLDSIIPPHHKGNGSHSDSPPTPSSLGPTSRGATPAGSTASGQTRSPIEASIPQITPPSISAFPVSTGRAITPRSPGRWLPSGITKGAPTGTIDAKQSPFLTLRDQGPISNGPGPSNSTDGGHNLMSARTYPPPLQRSTSPRHHEGLGPFQPWQSFERVGGNEPPHPAMPHHSESSFPYQQAPPADQGVPPPTAPTGQPQSFFSHPFHASGPASTMSQPGLPRAKGFEIPPSSTTAQSQYQIMTLETEQGPIQVPVDVQAASKVADEKRKRNATASHRFRQRRKEKERETSENISKLEAQIRDSTEEKEHYQKERDFFQDLILRHRIPLPPRPPSPRRRRYATMSGSSLSSYQDDEQDERGGRQTRRRTSAYVQPQGPSAMPTTMPSEPPTLPNFERISAMPSDHIHGAARLRPQGPYPPTTNAYHPTPPR